MAVEKERGAGGAAARPWPRATRDLERHVEGVKGRSRCMTTGRRRPRGAAQSRQRRRLGGDHLWRWRDRQAGGRTGTWMGSTGFDAEHQSPPTKESRALSEQRRHAVKARPGDIDDLGLGDLVRVPERGRVDAERLPMLCGPSGAWEGVEDREKHQFLGHSLVVLDATQSAGRRVFADG